MSHLRCETPPQALTRYVLPLQVHVTSPLERLQRLYLFDSRSAHNGEHVDSVLSCPYATGTEDTFDWSHLALLSQNILTAVLSLTEESEKPISPEIFYSYVWERVAIPDGFKGGIPT